MGTTLTIALFLPDFLVTGHIGDSKGYIIGNDTIRCLTGDHSVSGQLLASGKITNDEAVNHPQRHVLTRALGTGAEVDVEVLRHPWSPGQFVLLCTDGLTEVMSPAEIFETVNTKDTLDNKVNSLVNTVIGRGAPDNVTIILAQL
jgi:protein phosphatase